ncbi:MAG: HAMP domain-containing protein, partial [Candidimonas sp.]
MRRVSILSRLKVRTSLILVLVFFLFMLATGAAVGVYSLHADNQSLTRVVQAQRVHAVIGEAADHYKNVQSLLGQALASYIVSKDKQKNADAPAVGGDAGGSASPLGSDASTHVIEARKELTRSEAAFKNFQVLTKGMDDTDGWYRRTSDAYLDLMKNGVKPLIAMLEKGKLGDYETFLSSTASYMGDNLNLALNNLNMYQQDIIDGTYERQAQIYIWVIRAVAAAMVVAVLIALLAYVFLGRMVLRPLRLAGGHFDRIAGGDLTQRVEVKTRNEIGVLYESLKRMQESLT